MTRQWSGPPSPTSPHSCFNGAATIVSVGWPRRAQPIPSVSSSMRSPVIVGSRGGGGGGCRRVVVFHRAALAAFGNGLEKLRGRDTDRHEPWREVAR